MTIPHDRQQAGVSETRFRTAEDAEIKARARMLADQTCGDPVATMALFDAAALLMVVMATGMPDPRTATAELLSEQAQNTFELLEAATAMRDGQISPPQRKS